MGVLGFRAALKHGLRGTVEFEAIWAAHDLTIDYLYQHGRLPSSWRDLDRVFTDEHGRYGFTDMNHLRNYVEINFDHNSTRTWIIRLRGGRSNGETEAADRRLRKSVADVRSSGASLNSVDK